MATAPQITTPIGRIDLTKLDYTTMIDEVTSLIKNHPNYQTQFNSFFEGDAAVMLIELFCQVAHMNNLRIDFESNELSWLNAEEPDTILRFLPLIDFSLESVYGSSVEIIAEAIEETGGVSSVPIIIPARTQINAINLAGEDSTIELLSESDNYTGSIVLQPNIRTYAIEGYAGITETLEIDVSKASNFTFKINRPNVIHDSIQVFINENGSYTLLSRLDTFMSPLEVLPTYTVRFDFDGQPTFIFGNKFFGGNFDGIVDGNANTYKQLFIYYRYLNDSGGRITNYVPGSVEETLNFFAPSLGRDIALQFYNVSSGYGGSDIATLDEIKQIAPLLIRTADKAVTNEDHETFISQHQVVKDVNVITPVEEPTSTIPIFHIHIYVAPNRNTTDFIPVTETPAYNEMPAAEIGETYLEYNTRLQTAITNFYNITGMETRAELQSEFIDDTFTIIEGFNDELRILLDTDDSVSGFVNITLTDGTTRTREQIVEEINNEFENANPASIIGDSILFSSSTIGDTGYIQLAGDTSDSAHDAILAETYDTIGFAKNALSAGTTVTDEAEELLDLITGKRIAGIELVFRQIAITPFILTMDVYYNKNSNPADIEQDVLDELYINYSYQSAFLGSTIRKSEIIRLVMGIDGVEYIETDFTDLIAKTNEIIFLLDTDIINYLPLDDYPDLTDLYGVDLTMVRSS